MVKKIDATGLTADGSRFVSESDYEQLQQERDELAAYCEELKRVFITKHESDDSLATTVRDLFNKSPQTCLAEHDARVARDVANAFSTAWYDVPLGNVSFSDAYKWLDDYANKLVENQK